jgi:hypothetical protein
MNDPIKSEPEDISVKSGLLIAAAKIIDPRAIGELAVFLTLLFLLEIFVFGGRINDAIAPHPYWAAILYLSLRYGTNEGVSAAIICALLLFGRNVFTVSDATAAQTYFLNYGLQSALSIMAAVAIGQVRGRLTAEQKATVSNLEGARLRIASLEAENKALRTVNLNLEQQADGQMETVLALYQAAKSMEGVDRHTIIHALADLVQTVASPQKFSIYLLADGKLETAYRAGWTNDDRFVTTFDRSSRLYAAVIAGRKRLCTATREDEAILDGQGVLAAPLASVDTGQVVGMLKIESIGFTGVSAATLKKFDILCDWVGTAYARGQMYERAVSASAWNPEHTMLANGVFEQMTSLLSALGNRFDIHLSQIVISFADHESTPEDHRSVISAGIAASVAECLRKTDLAFEHRRTAWEYAILLPGANLTEAGVLAERLRNDLATRFDELDLSAAPNVSVRPISDNTGEPDALTAADEGISA